MTQSEAVREPTTEAGNAALNEWMAERFDVAIGTGNEFLTEDATRRLIVAIEQEARADARAEFDAVFQAALAETNKELDDAAAQTAAAVTARLRGHWLTAVECDHEAATDTARCSCSMWTGTPQPSVGEAVDQWIAHVLSNLESSVQVGAVAPGPGIAEAEDLYRRSHGAHGDD